MTHDYVRPGDREPLFAAYDLASGSVIARRIQGQPDCWEPDHGRYQLLRGAGTRFSVFRDARTERTAALAI